MPARQFLAPCRGLLFPLAGRLVFRPGLRLFFPYCLFLLALQRGGAGGFNVPQFVEGIVSAEKSLNLVRPRALDLAVKAVNLASLGDDDIAAGIAISQVIALFLKRLDESVRVFVVFLPDGCDRLCALFLRYAGAFLLLFFLIVGFFVLVAAAVLPHSGRQGETVIAGELPRDGLQLEPVMVNVDGLGGVGIDARPDGVAMLPTVLDVEDDGAQGFELGFLAEFGCLAPAGVGECALQLLLAADKHQSSDVGWLGRVLRAALEGLPVDHMDQRLPIGDWR